MRRPLLVLTALLVTAGLLGVSAAGAPSAAAAELPDIRITLPGPGPFTYMTDFAVTVRARTVSGATLHGVLDLYVEAKDGRGERSVQGAMPGEAFANGLSIRVQLSSLGPVTVRARYSSDTQNVSSGVTSVSFEVWRHDATVVMTPLTGIPGAPTAVTVAALPRGVDTPMWGGTIVVSRADVGGGTDATTLGSCVVVALTPSAGGCAIVLPPISTTGPVPMTLQWSGSKEYVDGTATLTVEYATPGAARATASPSAAPSGGTSRSGGSAPAPGGATVDASSAPASAVSSPIAPVGTASPTAGALAAIDTGVDSPIPVLTIAAVVGGLAAVAVLVLVILLVRRRRPPA